MLPSSSRNTFSALLLVLAIATLGAPHPVRAADGPEATQNETTQEDGTECNSKTDASNKEWMLSLGGTIIGTIALGAVGVTTLSRSLAGGGHRQSPATMAGMGLGAWLGGAAGAGIMLASECGKVLLPGWIGVTVSVLGFIVMLFAILTGKRD